MSAFTAMEIAHLNVRSLLSKFNDFKELLLSKNYLAFALSETWLSDKIVDEIITVPGYNLVRADRGTRGGGVALYLRNDLIYSVIPVSSNIEQLWVSLRINGVVFALGCVYKPPTTSHTFFTDELEESLALCMLQSRHIICLGDININFLDSDSASVKYMTDMLHSIDIEQIVSQPTHITANKASLIDVILCSNPSLISSCSVGGADISDHELVSCVLNIDDKLNIFNSRLIGLFDKHLPIKSSRITKPKAPWLNDEIKKMMKDRDAAKSKFRKTPSTLNWDSYKNSKNRVNHAISKAKRNYLHTITQSKNQKTIWKELRSLDIVNNYKTEIPAHLADADAINTHFVDGIPPAKSTTDIIEIP
nr:unnamed protein product [Callosobruchus chinensis]